MITLGIYKLEEEPAEKQQKRYVSPLFRGTLPPTLIARGNIVSCGSQQDIMMMDRMKDSFELAASA